MRGGGTLTVREVIDFMTKKNRNGIAGYELPKFDARLDRCPTFKISNKRGKETYLDEAIRASKNRPSPAQYNSTMHEEIEEKRRKSSMERSKKITFAELQEKYEQKNRYPGPGAYYR